VEGEEMSCGVDLRRGGLRATGRGVIEREYREWLRVPGTSPVITLGIFLFRGPTPLLPAPVLSERTGCDVSSR